MADQLNIFDAPASLDPQVVVEMEAEPGWVWAQCPVCKEYRYLRRRDTGAKCASTMGCEGRLEARLDCLCVVCGKPVTRRRVGKDTGYCSKKCEKAS